MNLAADDARLPRGRAVPDVVLLPIEIMWLIEGFEEKQPTEGTDLLLISGHTGAGS